MAKAHATPPPARSGLIVNPRAGRGHGKGMALAALLKGDPRVSLHILDDFAQLGPALARMAEDGVTHLFISSGDGTIQEILTRLAGGGPFAALPRLGLLPHGTTNLSGPDLGFRHGTLAAQAAFLRQPSPREIRQRHTIHCLNPGDGRPRHGLFVGTGAVAVATRHCQQAFNDRGVRGQMAVAGTLLTALRKHFFSAADPGDETRFDRPFRITVEADGRIIADGPQLLHMSTTLDTLVLGTRPFWGGKTAPIRTSVFPYPPPSVLRWILPVMYGGENRTSPPGAVSFCAHALRVASEDVFVIDGEFFPPPAGAPLRLETGPLFSFIRS